MQAAALTKPSERVHKGKGFFDIRNVNCEQISGP